MDKTFKISTIVPVYNTEKYLSETVDCVLGQTIGFSENIQLIFVDDCSTDRSGEICKEYERLYPENTQYIKLEVNSGVSAARNTGLKYAKGKYVNFLDSDDKWSENAYQRLFDFLEEHRDEIDMASSDVWYFEAKEGPHMLNQCHEEDCIIDMERDYRELRSLGSNCLVRRKVAEAFPFNEKQKCWEDSVFINTVILNKRKYGMLKGDVRFYYRLRTDCSSASNRLYRRTKRYYLEDLAYFFWGIYGESMKRCGYFVPMCQYFVMNAVQARFQDENTAKVLNEDERKAYGKLLKEILEKIEDKYILEIVYADELCRKAMLAYKYGADMWKDIVKLRREKVSIYRRMNRTKTNNRLLVRWFRAIQKGKCRYSYFEENGYKKIVVYGVSDIGELLIEELKDTDIEILYGLDKRADKITAEIPVYKPNERLPLAPPDVIVVTAVYFFEEIVGELRENGMNIPMVSLEEVLDFMEQEAADGEIIHTGSHL